MIFNQVLGSKKYTSNQFQGDKVLDLSAGQHKRSYEIPLVPFLTADRTKQNQTRNVLRKCSLLMKRNQDLSYPVLRNGRESCSVKGSLMTKGLRWAIGE